MLVETRSFDEAKITSYLEKREYNYDKDPKYEQNLIRRWWISIWNKIRESIGKENMNITWNVIKVLIIFLGLAILFQFLFRSNKTRVFKKGDKSPDYNPLLIKSEGAKENLQYLIEKAEHSKNLDEALRYRFLDTLRILNEEKIIEWKDYKTNLDYISEINEKEIASHFESLSEIFEYVVYGEFPINDASYVTYKSSFEAFHTSLEKIIT
jgi:hypothetical protein